MLYYIKLLLLFLVFTSFNGSDGLNTDVGFRCDYKYSKVAGGWFKHHVMPATWHDARLWCESENAMLASPTSPEMVSEMTLLMKTYYRPETEIFTGIHATISPGVLQSLDGKLFSEMNASWADNEPDFKYNENCVTFNHNGNIADRTCEEKRPYICFRPLTNIELNEACHTVDPDYHLDSRTNKCYKFHTVARNFTRANFVCNAEGGHLLIINDATEFQVVMDEFDKYEARTIGGSFFKAYAYIGAYDWHERGAWRTIYGEPIKAAGYATFRKMQTDKESKEEVCLVVDRHIVVYDVSCSAYYPFICEKTPDYPPLCKGLEDRMPDQLETGVIMKSKTTGTIWKSAPPPNYSTKTTETIWESAPSLNYSTTTTETTWKSAPSPNYSPTATDSIIWKSAPSPNYSPTATDSIWKSASSPNYSTTITETIWKLAPSPNYSTNFDLEYPYSEVPHLGDCNVTKIPVSLNHLISHVDYWGEGRIESNAGIRGFPNSYNVNLQYKLVSSGADKGRKIPNRIPVVSDIECDTSRYIRDNTVITVTVSGPVTSSCAKDVSRIVNDEIGKVVVYGYNRESPQIIYLSQELEKKELFYNPNYRLPSELQGVMWQKEHVNFVNLPIIKEELLKSITTEAYDVAVIMSKHLYASREREALKEIVKKFIKSKRIIMNYAYKLYYSGAKSIVQRYFPAPFALIYNQDFVKIVNKGYDLALKLDESLDSKGERLAWADCCDKSSKNISWKFIPVWENNSVSFKLFNVRHDMYMKIEDPVDDIGDRRALGSNDGGELRHKYYLEPFMRDDTIMFYIVNRLYNMYLKLAVSAEDNEDRALWGHNDGGPDKTRFHWIVSEWN